ncbi:MAG: zinc ribbon domain-containing protein [Oscillospiraceae bacterium]|nr:zinc ribbon domain-containing protein [Oscillospiraceae bacterium]
MFCPYCGNQLPDDAHFCNQCGRQSGSAYPTNTAVFRTGSAGIGRKCDKDRVDAGHRGRGNRDSCGWRHTDEK